MYKNTLILTKSYHETLNLTRENRHNPGMNCA